MSGIGRRDFLAGVASWGMAGGIFPAVAGAQADRTGLDTSGQEMILTETQRAIHRGLEFLASRQSEIDGAFASTGYGQDVAVAGLAGMAFMAGGSMPARGPFGPNVERCIDFILNNSLESGFISVADVPHHGPMYGHGFATLFLSEVYGMTSRDDVRDALAKAVKIIAGSQNADGGWRYQPKRDDADLSVTICQVMALRAARNAGIYVPNETIDRCIEYVKRSQNPDGGFMYMIQGGPSEFPRSAAGVVALYSAGIYEGDEIHKGLEYLMQHVPRSGASSRQPYFFYGHYYAVQAMWHAGGDYWQRWYPAVRDVLTAQQHDDGSWTDLHGPEYATAMACIILQMPNNYLPIFQR